MEDNDMKLQSAIFRSNLMVLCTFIRPRYILPLNTFITFPYTGMLVYYFLT